MAKTKQKQNTMSREVQPQNSPNQKDLPENGKYSYAFGG
jgi:hypothetical protein